MLCALLLDQLVYNMASFSVQYCIAVMLEATQDCYHNHTMVDAEITGLLAMGLACR